MVDLRGQAILASQQKRIAAAGDGPDPASHADSNQVIGDQQTTSTQESAVSMETACLLMLTLSSGPSEAKPLSDISSLHTNM